jgi:hypothetical protein
MSNKADTHECFIVNVDYSCTTLSKARNARFPSTALGDSSNARMIAVKEEDEEEGGCADEEVDAGASGGDAAAAVERGGVRPELAAALAAPRPRRRLLLAWSLLLAHLLAIPPGRPGRRALALALRNANE